MADLATGAFRLRDRHGLLRDCDVVMKMEDRLKEANLSDADLLRLTGRSSRALYVWRHSGKYPVYVVSIVNLVLRVRQLEKVVHRRSGARGHRLC